MSDVVELFFDGRFDLGEGPLWHGVRQELFWFDINAGKLFHADQAGVLRGEIQFDEPVAAAAIVDDDTLLVASASALILTEISTGTMRQHMALEADNPLTRANDSRVCRQGAWWIGTMGTSEGNEIGSVYHYRDGLLSLIRDKVTIPNAICFSPDGSLAYFADTLTRKIERMALDRDTGKPAGDWEVFVDLAGEPGAPDGAVCDAEGFVWSAEYGGGRVVRYAPDGSVERIISVPAPNVTCPCFGGDDLRTLYITTARQGMSAEKLAQYPQAGGVFQARIDVPGQAETPVRL